MSDDAADIRDRLHNLATLAPPGAGLTDPAQVVQLHRARRRRQTGWAGLAAAAALVVVGASTLLPRGPVTEPADQATSPSTSSDAGRGLYDLAPRGSLADDDDLISQALAASWDDGTRDSETPVIDPPPDTRRVSFIGTVPGGQAWALVQGLIDDQAYFIWFADIDTGDGITWQRVWGPDEAFPDTPIALLDDAGDTGPLVVVTTPGYAVQFSSTGTGDTPAAPGYQYLPDEDGIAIATVATPTYPRFSLGFRIIYNNTITYEQAPHVFDSTQPLGPQAPYVPPPDAPPAAEYGQRMATCLSPLGFDVTITGSGDGFSFDTPADEQAFDQAVDRCSQETGYS